MFTQVELWSGGECRVFWLEHNPFDGEVLKQGQKICLIENPYDVWLVSRLFLSLEKETSLPPKAQVRQILSLIDDADGQAELAQIYPQIMVSGKRTS